MNVSSTKYMKKKLTLPNPTFFGRSNFTRTKEKTKKKKIFKHIDYLLSHSHFLVSPRITFRFPFKFIIHDKKFTAFTKNISSQSVPVSILSFPLAWIFQVAFVHHLLWDIVNINMNLYVCNFLLLLLFFFSFTI